MSYRVVFLYTILLFLSKAAFSQYYDTGQDPASIKWMQIKTVRFTIIYPESYGNEGATFARSLDQAYSKLVTLYLEKKFRIPVIIHSYTTQSNGYVSWAPHRMELYPTPEQNTIPLSSEKQLAIHELTHVFQMESLAGGFSKVMSVFFGEQFTGIAASMLPLWFLEGDAVFAETALTQSGRGRTPAFQKQLKAIVIEQGEMYKYDKVVNDSYKDFVPDYYQTGYQAVAWSLSKYDPQIWNKALHYTANNPFTINPVNISLKRNAGLTKKKLFEETFDSLKTIWTNDLNTIKARSYESVNPSKKARFINYYSPVYVGKDSVFAIKTSLDYVPEFVLIDALSKSEKKLHTPGQIYPWFFSYGKGKLVWVETEIDPRWENRDYSVIKVMDLKSRFIRKLSHKSRFLSASVSPDGRIIAASENTTGNKNNLVFINATTGSVIERIPAPENCYLQRPQWSEEGGRVSAIFLTDAGEGIISYTIENHRWESLIEAGRNDLQSTFLRNDSLFFISSSSGTDNIYLRTPDKKIMGLTNSRFGTIDLFVIGKEIFFSDYTSLGNNICSINLEKTDEITLASNIPSSFLINRIKEVPESADNGLTNTYKPEQYRKWQHLFTFHSWMPFYADLEEIKSDPASVRPGITIMSQNNLSTLVSTFGYEYSSEKRHVFHSRVTWKGWYPVVESQLDYGYNTSIAKLGEEVSNPVTVQPGINFTNTVSIPLSFTSGRFSEYLRPSISSEYRNNYVYIKETGFYDYGQTILTGRLYISNYRRSSYRDIYPRWAQTLDLNYSFAPFDKDIYGTGGVLKTSFYFPGIFRGNGIKIRVEREKQSPIKYFFGNKISLPRGYKNIFAEELNFFSVDYVLPVAYPDFSISSLLYLKRIRAGLFYDYASGPGNSIFKYNGTTLTPLSNMTTTQSIKSFGYELLADFHIFRVPYMISGGVQTAWRSFNEAPVFELLFNINLYGMSIGRRRM